MFVADSLKFPELEQFCKSLIHGTRERQDAIDHAIAAAAINWKIERMAAVDRAILRLSVFEMVFAPEPTPPRVVITEAVEIASEADKAVAANKAKARPRGPTEAAKIRKFIAENPF